MGRTFRSITVITAIAALTFSAAAAATVTGDSAPEIAHPSEGQLVFSNTLSLEATVIEEEPVRWAVRASQKATDPECIAQTDLVGNVRGFDTPSEVDGASFSAGIDISGWSAGEYCFAVNQGDPGVGSVARDIVFFYIVDDYAKVSGNIDNAAYLTNYHSELDLKVLRGRGQLSHAFDGVVGNAGAAGTVGSITVNYRQLDEYVVYEAQSLNLSAATGIGVTDPTARAAVLTVGGSEIILLDKDASASFDRGAVIVRFEGSPSTSKYEIDATPGSTGADSWIGLVNGNVEVGVR